MEPLKFDRLPLNTNWFTLLKVTEPAPISGPLKTLGLLDRKLKPTPVPATFNVLVNTRVKLVVSNTTPLLRVRLPGPTALAALRRKVPPLTFTPPRNCAVPWLKFLSLIHISEPTRLGMISYAVFCLKKKTKTVTT